MLYRPEFMSIRPIGASGDRALDILADVLDAVQFKGTVYCQTEFCAPWGVQWQGRAGRAGFFMVVRGGCYLESAFHPQPVALSPGDFVMSPRSCPYVLRDSLQSEVALFDDVLGDRTGSHTMVKFGGNGAATKLVMGCFELDVAQQNPFLRSLPEFIHIRAEDLQTEPWLDVTLRFLASECANEKPGSTLAIGRLTDLLFVQALRVYVAQQLRESKGQGWLLAMSDPQIGKALSMVHAEPAHSWTVEKLAKEVNMSRSSFAAKFADMTESTPLDYVTSLRMQRASKLLVDGEQNIGAVAFAVGYKSEAAFSKAFKRTTGSAPGRYRRHKSA